MVQHWPGRPEALGSIPAHRANKTPFLFLLTFSPSFSCFFGLLLLFFRVGVHVSVCISVCVHKCVSVCVCVFFQVLRQNSLSEAEFRVETCLGDIHRRSRPIPCPEVAEAGEAGLL